MDRGLRYFACLIAVFFLMTACGSWGGLGGLGDILGSTGNNDPSDVEGMVTGIDSRDRRIDLDVYEVNNLRESRPDSSIYYDERTVVLFQGNRYEPTDLERGDVIEADGANVGGRYIASEIRVVRNVRS